MKTRATLWNLLSICAALAMALSNLSYAAAARPSLPDGAPAQQTGGGISPLDARIAHSRQGRQGFGQGQPGVMSLTALGNQEVAVSVLLNQASLSSSSDGMTSDQRLAYAQQVSAYEDQAASQIEAAGGSVVYKFHTLTSGLIVHMPGQAAARIAQIPQVARISRIFDYQKTLSNTVPFIGASAIKAAGYNGSGVKVAILDSGIDYTHAAFGGPGTVPAWQNAYYGSPACQAALGRVAGCANSAAPDPALFGAAAPHVKGGFDWVGPVWPNGPLMPDPNPIDNRFNAAAGDDGGHGTHVADIIGGSSFSGVGEGVAPGADLYAFTVCSAVSNACSGEALLKALDDAADLDGNPATKDPADVVNLSLGVPYGQPEADDTYLVNQLVIYGSVVVVSVGNDGDKPYVLGGPANASGSIAVAETTYPTSLGYLLESPSLTAPLPLGIRQTWSAAITTNVSAALAYDTTNANTRLGCNANGSSPWAGTPLAGKIVLVDRGVCNVSTKAFNAQVAGAVMALVADTTPQGPFDLPTSYSTGGETIIIPALSLTQLDGNALKTALTAGAVNLNIPAAGTSLAYSVTPTSSRGPRNHDNVLKPDIAAPGASTSAIAGSGAGSEAFGGTSGAAPMVSGVVALLKQVHGDAQNFTKPNLSPQQYKALLMNSAGNQIFKNGAQYDANGVATGYLASISRIGAGQVDAQKAFKTNFLAWDSTSADPLQWTGSLSFAYQPVTSAYTATRKLTVLNLDSFQQEYYVSSEFRYANDSGKGVSISVSPNDVIIPAKTSKTVTVTLTINPATAPGSLLWPADFNRGAGGYNGYLLDQVEVDGYLYVDKLLGGISMGYISLPWSVLPKAAANVSSALTSPGNVTLTNTAAYVNANVRTFSLMEDSSLFYNYTIGNCASIGLAPGCSVSPVDINQVGVDYDPTGGVLYFAITLWDKPYRAGQLPAEFDIYMDTNGDHKDDTVVFNLDQSENLTNTDGRNAVFFRHVDANGNPLDLPTLLGYVQSNFDSNNYILPVPVAPLGIDPAKQLGFYVLSFDIAFGGSAYDLSPYDRYYDLYTPLKPRFALVNAADRAPVVNKSGSKVIRYTHLTGSDEVLSGSQTGLLFLYNEAPIGKESDYVVLGDPLLGLVYLPYVQN